MRWPAASARTTGDRDSVSATVLLDTGPLVAVLDRRDQWHDAAAGIWPTVIRECVVTEAVVTEATHLVGRGGGDAALPLEFLLRAGVTILALPAGAHQRAATLMRRYESVPMDYADATLVAAGEALGINVVFTFDQRGFDTYRLPRGKRFARLPD